MANTVQHKRGTTAQVNSYTGAVGEFIYNTTTKRIHAQDGATAGGIPHALVSDVDLKANASVTISAGTGLTGGGTLAANRTLALSSASIASLALADSAVQSVNGKTGSSITLTKADVGLGSVDNTSDANKPISTATQTALNAKANSSVTITAGTGLTGGGNLTANRTLALNAASIASLGKADTALQAPGGTTGQILAKNSGADNDVLWVTSEAATAVSYGPQTLTEAQQVQARQNIQADKSYDSIASVAAATVPAFANAIRTNGYYAAGDGGGALYKRVASEPTHAGKVQSADGAWWELSEAVVNVLQFGAKGDNTNDDSINIQSAIDYLKDKGRSRLEIPGFGRVYNFQSKRPAGLTPVAFEDPNLFFSEVSDLEIVGIGNPVLTNSNYPNNRAEIFMFYKCSRIRVSGIVFQGNNLGLPNEINNCGIGMLSCVGMQIFNNHFTGFQGSYIASSWLFDSNIFDNRFDVLGGSGIDCAFWQNVTVRGNTFKGNQLGNNGLGTQGIQHLYDAPNMGNNETGVAYIGGSSNNIRIVDNVIENFTTGIIMGDAYDFTIRGNTLRGNGLNAILITNGDPTTALFAMTGGVISENKITRNGVQSNSAAVRVEKGNASLVEIVMRDNVIQDNKNQGVNADATVILKMTNNRLGNKYTADQTDDVVNYESLGVGSLLAGNYPINPRPPYGPSIPSGTNVTVFNNNPFPVTVLQQDGTGMVFVSPELVETVAFPNDAKTFRLSPYWGVKFTGSNTSGWLWIPD